MAKNTELIGFQPPLSGCGFFYTPGTIFFYYFFFLGGVIFKHLLIFNTLFSVTDLADSFLQFGKAIWDGNLRENPLWNVFSSKFT